MLAGRVALLAALLAILAAGPVPAGAQSPPLVAAAADLAAALPEVAEAFTRETGQRVELVFGASGTLARQIQAGAPFELFLSADEALVARLHAAGLTEDAGALYAMGRLVLYAPAGSPIDPRQGLAGLAAVAAEGRLTRFVIANPAHAPYGRAAEAALRAAGAWESLHPRLVLGENASQAARFAGSGETAGGLIPHALALAPALAARGSFALVPADLHPPLRQRMVLLRRAGPAARRFQAFLRGAAARSILERHGFTLPAGA